MGGKALFFYNIPFPYRLYTGKITLSCDPASNVLWTTCQMKLCSSVHTAIKTYHRSIPGPWQPQI